MSVPSQLLNHYHACLQIRTRNRYNSNTLIFQKSNALRYADYVRAYSKHRNQH